MRCWIAPRDIIPGTDWGEAIVDAISAAKIMVLIFSGHANASPQIKREVERAVHKGVPIIPVRIEDIAPNRSLEFFISTPHWLDAFTPPIEQRLKQLAVAVKALLQANPAQSPRPSQSNQPSRPTRLGLARAIFREVWGTGFAAGVSFLAIISAIFLALSGFTRAAVFVVTGVLLAVTAILLLAPLVLHEKPTIKIAGKVLAWAVSFSLVAFLALIEISVAFKWPGTTTALLGIEDGVTCGRPSELVKAFSCGATDPSYIVANIRLDDLDNGLMIREGPDMAPPGRAVHPNATGIVITDACTSEGPEGWCPVECRSLGLKGWSRRRYLRPRSEAMYTASRFNSTEPDGLVIRSGPFHACRSVGVLPYQSRDVITHYCQRSPNDQTNWCRITFNGFSGWILDGFLEHQN